MPYSGMLRRVVLVRTYVSEEYIASIIRVTRILLANSFRPDSRDKVGAGTY
jgi:hypothetical protein